MSSVCKGCGMVYINRRNDYCSACRDNIPAYKILYNGPAVKLERNKLIVWLPQEEWNKLLFNRQARVEEDLKDITIAWSDASRRWIASRDKDHGYGDTPDEALENLKMAQGWKECK